jgi:hypothetical protein
VSGGTVNPARRANSGAGWPSAARLTAPGSPSRPKANPASAADCAELSRTAPIRANSSTTEPKTGSSTMQVCSAGQITEASNVLEISVSTTMPVTSADRCTYTGALPGPTLRHGFPAAFVSATIFGPPVVQRKSTPGWPKR